jgi:hypothetical protein
MRDDDARATGMAGIRRRNLKTEKQGEVADHPETIGPPQR